MKENFPWELLKVLHEEAVPDPFKFYLLFFTSVSLRHIQGGFTGYLWIMAAPLAGVLPATSNLQNTNLFRIFCQLS
jgi:hypothetical protein